MGGPAPRLLGGRYELGDPLGYGGMADVFRGRDTRLDRTVAVKLLRADLARDPAFRARFRREAQASASLNHPAIVQVFDTGEDDEGDGPARPYIVMELVEGRTLRAVLEEQGRLPLQEALVVAADVCAALHYSHERGLVHRDVKPGNVMVTDRAAGDDSSGVKVMDFGIARAAASAQTVTATAAVLGTAQYLSPEQARGEDVDARSDVYSTGCLLYELVTGRPPFTGDSPVAVAYQQVREAPTPPSAVLGEVPPDVDAVVLHAMAKNPDNRYSSAAEMREDLLRAANGRPVHAPRVAPPPGPGPQPAEEPTTVLRRSVTVPPPPPDDDGAGRRGLAYAVLGLTLLALLVGGAFLARELLSGSGTERVTVPEVEGLPLAEASEQVRASGLVVGEITREFSDRPVDEVLLQSPSARTTHEAGTAVDLTVSSGVEQVEVPLLVGIPRQEAETALRNAGLRLGEVRTTDAVAPAGQVRASDPPQGTEVDRGSTVDLVVASGNVPVPDVVGEEALAAAAVLGRQGFEVEQVDVATSEAAPGTVLDQDPDAGTAAPAGSTITIRVATAPPSPTPEPTRTPTPRPTATVRPPSPSATASPTTSPSPSPDVSVQAGAAGP